MNRKLALPLVLLLAVAHQDFFFADDATLVFGFLPVGLAYHALYCVAVSLLWVIVIRYAWPVDLIALAEDEEPPRPEA